jgi:hypothetical protein
MLWEPTNNQSFGTIVTFMLRVSPARNQCEAERNQSVWLAKIWNYIEAEETLEAKPSDKQSEPI